MSFCSNSNFRNQVEDLIYNDLFSVSTGSAIPFRSILKDWYDKITSLQTSNNTVWQSTSMSPNTMIRIGRKKDALLDVGKSVFSSNNIIDDLLKKGYTHIGHDVPVWLIPDSVNGNLSATLRIMIIGQDPRRDLEGDGILLSTPFGLHCQAYYNDKIETRIADRLLNMQKNGKGISLYFTDSYKLFVKDSKNPESVSTKLLKEYSEVFTSILNKEIELFKPDLIVCWGGFSAKQVLGKKTEYFQITDYNGYKVLPVMHTSGLAAGSRKKIREKLGFDHDEEMYVGEIYNAL